ncbi:MAG: hypothetical protein IJX35_00445 [Candidatus Methanomethylophilaceae archaeon]|nr:hypothetical protein [Candidatus Methanomethylophilaceae archaeon]
MNALELVPKLREMIGYVEDPAHMDRFDAGWTAALEEVIGYIREVA